VLIFVEGQNEYHQWYGAAHAAPELLSNSVYGLVERHRKELVGATLIAVPGCYPTASVLALGPFLDAELIERRGIVVNALSGTSAPGAPREIDCTSRDSPATPKRTVWCRTATPGDPTRTGRRSALHAALGRDESRNAGERLRSRHRSVLDD